MHIRDRHRSKNRGIEYRYSIPLLFLTVLITGIEYRSNFFPVLNTSIEYRSDFFQYLRYSLPVSVPDAYRLKEHIIAGA
jgi:hypothetical protein